MTRAFEADVVAQAWHTAGESGVNYPDWAVA